MEAISYDDETDFLLDSMAIVEAGVEALAAVARGEAADPAVLEALAVVLSDDRLIMTATMRAAAVPVREVRAGLPEDRTPPPADVRERAERCRVLIRTPIAPTAQHAAWL